MTVVYQFGGPALLLVEDVTLGPVGLRLPPVSVQLLEDHEPGEVIPATDGLFSVTNPDRARWEVVAWIGAQPVRFHTRRWARGLTGLDVIEALQRKP